MLKKILFSIYEICDNYIGVITFSLKSKGINQNCPKLNSIKNNVVVYNWHYTHSKLIS